MAARPAGDEVKRLAHRQDDPKIQLHPTALACRARDRLHQIRDIGLRALVEFHVGIDRKGIAALRACTFPVAVGLHAATINAEPTGLADRASDGAEA